MKGAQQKINKLILALNQKGRIILISPRQFYSKKLSKVCTCYEITEGTPRKQKLNKELKEIKKEIKELKKKKEDIKELVEKCNKIKKELEKFLKGKFELFGKVNVLMFLANLYKEVKANEKT